MAIARTCWFVLVSLLVASAGAAAQKSPLAITGTVTQVKVEGPSVAIPVNKNNLWEGIRYERTETWFNVSVRMQYCNRGEVTLIVPARYSFPNVRKKILFLELPASDSKVSLAVSGKPFSGGHDPMETFIKELEKPEPSPYYFAMIEPETCYESSDVIMVRTGYKVEVRKSGVKNRPDFEVAVPEHSYFKIQYSLSMKDSLPVADAKRRWRALGRLLTSADGDFFFETDFIINKLLD